ncbi:MAG: hypothetical protein HZA37_01745 [Parcubacteria group bacterium]|nr:hypothetical protein [Parcubacteria group bacterium]
MNQIIQKLKTFFENKKIVIAGAVLLILALLVWLFMPDIFEKARIDLQGGRVINEQLVVPETKEFVALEGTTVYQSQIQVPLNPKNNAEKIIVPKAALTVKGGYALAAPEAILWSPDSKPVFIKSLGAVTLDGKSSQWQLAFSSKTKPQKGYEIVIQENLIVSKKEVDSGAIGADFPKNWFDSDGAVKSLQALPQFSEATISAINFFYNHDAKRWRYGIATSIGSTSIAVE